MSEIYSKTKLPLLYKQKEKQLCRDAFKNFIFSEDIQNQFSDDYFTSPHYKNYTHNRKLFKLPKTVEKTEQSSLARLKKFHQINGETNTYKKIEPFYSQNLPKKSTFKMKIKKECNGKSFNNFNKTIKRNKNIENNYCLFYKEEIKKFWKKENMTIKTPVAEFENVDLSIMSLNIISDLYSMSFKTREKACNLIIENKFDISEDVQEKLMNMVVNDCIQEVKNAAISILLRDKSIKKYQKFVLCLLKGDESDKRKAIILLRPEILDVEISFAFKKLFQHENFVIRKLCCSVCGNYKNMIEKYFKEIAYVCKNDLYESARKEALSTIIKSENKNKLSKFISNLILMEEDDSFLENILEFMENSINFDEIITQSMKLRKGLENKEINR